MMLGGFSNNAHNLPLLVASYDKQGILWVNSKSPPTGVFYLLKNVIVYIF